MLPSSDEEGWRRAPGWLSAIGLISPASNARPFPLPFLISTGRKSENDGIANGRQGAGLTSEEGRSGEIPHLWAREARINRGQLPGALALTSLLMKIEHQTGLRFDRDEILATVQSHAPQMNRWEESSLRIVWQTVNMSMKVCGWRRTQKSIKMKVDPEELMKTKGKINDKRSYADELLKISALTFLPMSY